MPINCLLPCADPGIFVGGVGGGSTSICQKSSDNVVCFFFFFFLVLSLFYRSQMVTFKEKCHFSRFRRGSKFFQGVGGPTFSRGGGSNCLFPIETYTTCDFPGGVRTPCPLPLDPGALGCDLFSFPVRKMMRSPLALRCLFSCNFVVFFQSSPAIKSFRELTA